MDEDSLRNWGYYEPSVKGHLSLQLMSSMVDRHTKPLLSGHDNNPSMVSPNGTYYPRDRVATELPATHMDYVRDSWINHREKFLHMFPTNTFDPVLSETSGPHHAMAAPHQPDPTKDTELNMEEPSVKKGHAPAKKRAAPATPKTSKSKKPRKGPVLKENGKSFVHRAKISKKNMDVVINGVDFDISGIPIPICSCTGTPQQCYRWGCGGWQSACCTMTISMYPLPMSTKRRGTRISGRKMSQGAFKKVLEKLASEGYDFCNSIDLRTYWAKHGTNKFVTIR